MVCVPNTYRHTSFLGKKKILEMRCTETRKRRTWVQKLETVTGISVLFSELSRVSGDCGYDVGTEWKLGDNDVRRAEDGAGAGGRLLEGRRGRWGRGSHLMMFTVKMTL